jgi:5-methylcytosine-specific restriction endonuclease McrA
MRGIAMRQSQAHLAWETLSAVVTGGAACRYCGSADDLVAHHKIPRRYGGLDVLSNLEPVCRRCHPGVEREAVARAKLVWERPAWPESPHPNKRRPRMIRPY